MRWTTVLGLMTLLVPAAPPAVVADNTEWAGFTCGVNGVVEPGRAQIALDGGPWTAFDVLADDDSGVSWHGAADVEISCSVQLNQADAGPAPQGHVVSGRGRGIAHAVGTRTFAVMPGDQLYLCTHVFMQHVGSTETYVFDEDDNVANGEQCNFVTTVRAGVTCALPLGEACYGITPSTEVTRVNVTSVAAPPGAVHALAGYVDLYRFRLPNGGLVTVPCVVLVVDGTVDPCGAAGGTFVSRFETLYDTTVAERRPAAGPPLSTVRVCEATVALTYGEIGVTEFPAYSLC